MMRDLGSAASDFAYGKEQHEPQMDSVDFGTFDRTSPLDGG